MLTWAAFVILTLECRTMECLAYRASHSLTAEHPPPLSPTPFPHPFPPPLSPLRSTDTLFCPKKGQTHKISTSCCRTNFPEFVVFKLES
jgi:hypothetical protein